MKKYGDLIPCGSCGEAKPRRDYSRSALLAGTTCCKACVARRAREWREKNPERVKALNKKHVALRRNARQSYEDFPKLLTCRKCEERKRREEFYLSNLHKLDYICKLCSNERTNRTRRIRRGLMPKAETPRPTLPDWSSF